MLEWEIEKNVISKLYYKGENLINPWGVETADSSSFFSLEEGIGWRYEVVNEHHDVTERVNYSGMNILMSEGGWKLEVNDHLDDMKIQRKVELETYRESYFMDFVLRYRFKKEAIEFVEIAGNKYTHRDTNVYYQFKTDSVNLFTKRSKIEIKVKDSQVPSGMEPVLYVRDHKGEWVVHVRMIPVKWDKEVIKLCTSIFSTRPIPTFLSNLLLKSDWIRESLWYRGERKPFKSRLFRKLLNPAAFGMVKVESGEKLAWNVEMRFRER